MNTKNRKFEIYKSKWNLEFVDSVETFGDEEFRYGECDTLKKTIRIALKDNDGGDIDKRDVDVTIAHEFIHCMLDEGGYNEISANEPLVEWLAKCVVDLKEQGIF